MRKYESVLTINMSNKSKTFCSLFVQIQSIRVTFICQ